MRYFQQKVSLLQKTHTVTTAGTKALHVRKIGHVINVAQGSFNIACQTPLAQHVTSSTHFNQWIAHAVACHYSAIMYISEGFQ